MDIYFRGYMTCKKKNFFFLSDEVYPVTTRRPAGGTLDSYPACSASLLMNDTDVRFNLLHTYILKRVLLAVFSASAVSLNEDINT